MHTSIALKSRPFHALCQSLAFFGERNFMRTMYLFALPVRINLK